MTSVLVVSPAFHGYWRAIEASLRALGHEVSTVRYDENSSLAAKVRQKAVVELPERLGRVSAHRLAAMETASVLRAIEGLRPDVCVILKGDTLDEPFWDLLERRRIPRVIWLYDEIRRTHHRLADLVRRGPIASYSQLDVEALGAAGARAAHVPLGFDDSIRVLPRPMDEVSFIGARYPNREGLLAHLVDEGIPVRAFGRQWSDAWTDRLRTWRLHPTRVPAEGDLPRSQAYAVMAGSPATINIHGDQDGFTMRTFEASGVGGLQLVDRPDVSAHYEPGTEVAVFTSSEELADLSQRAISDRRWSEGLRNAGRRRTLAEHTITHRIRVLEQMWQA